MLFIYVMMKSILIKTPSGGYVNAATISAIEVKALSKGYAVVLKFIDAPSIELAPCETLADAEEHRDSIAESIGEVSWCLKF